MTTSPGRFGAIPPRARGDAKVEAELRQRIRAQGRITFAEYMETALYLLGGGYYEARAAIGRQGDFLTSPETHPAFGALLARLVYAQWQALGEPAQFDVVEYGAGTGSLCRQLVTASATFGPAFADSLRYTIIEASSYLRAEQQARLLDLSNLVAWGHPDQPGGFATGCVLANEVVDALPVHRVEVEGGRLREIYVGLAADRFIELTGEPSTSDLEIYFRRVGVRPPEGSVTEVCLAARPWLLEAARRVEHGYLTVIDYGGTAASLYSKATPRGLLKCFYRHGWTEDPYDRPGLQDMTVPVDFTNLVLAGGAAGLEVISELSQHDLLRRLGLPRMLREVEALNLPVAERERNLRAVQALADPEGLGRFRVLLQQKEAPGFRFPAEDVEAEMYTPLLPSTPKGW